MKVRMLAAAVAVTLSCQAFAEEQEYLMSCAELATDMSLEITEEGRERFANLAGSCMGIVDRDGALYMHTSMVVRRVRGNTVTLYIPANDSTIEVQPDSDSRVDIGGRKVRPRDLSRGQELDLFISVDKFTQPVIDEIMMPTESGELVAAPAAPAPALPTTG